MSGGELPPAMRRLCAWRQLRLLREYPRLVPRLLRQGLAEEDARAVAFNAALVYYAAVLEPPLRSPAEALERMSLGEIAALCEVFRRVEAGELEYGEREGTV